MKKVFLKIVLILCVIAALYGLNSINRSTPDEFRNEIEIKMISSMTNPAIVQEKIPIDETGITIYFIQLSGKAYYATGPRDAFAMGEIVDLYAVKAPVGIGTIYDIGRNRFTYVIKKKE